MKKRFLYVALLMAGLMPMQQLHAQRLQQKLGRGVVAVQRSNNVLISWRKLAQEGDSAKRIKWSKMHNLCAYMQTIQKKRMLYFVHNKCGRHKTLS